jgi:lipopolysaccharide/colanic/teichoic acid biosynthesis glycosyltransferase
MFKFYRPSRIAVTVDILMLILSYYVVLNWFPLTTHQPFDKYSWPTFFFTLVWIIISYFLKRYKFLGVQKYFSSSIALLYTCEIIFVLFAILIHFIFKSYSGFVLLSIILGAFSVNYIFLSLYFAYRFAVEYNDFSTYSPEERVNAQVKSANRLDEESYNLLCSTIRSHSSEKVLHFLEKSVDLWSGNTFVYVLNQLDNLKMLPKYQYSTIIQLEKLNNMREINKKLTVINEKLADNGIFMCCFESKSTRKDRILRKNIPGINYFLYFFDYLFKRLMPKFLITKRLYYFLTNGKNRIFSKAEVLGRLYCYGYKIIMDKKIGQINYIFAQRIKQPEPFYKKNYGLLIRLPRLGKGGKSFYVYKFRTMHPYSEYLQSYIFEKYSLRSGGKFNKDIRVSTIGSLFRKYWLDELPMIYNLLKGEMKLVGVRPLSVQYFNLYSEELQQKRIKFKPGLFPPFYADLPKTLDEIQESEMRYLLACDKNGIFVTDFQYFFKILNNILFKKARSA